MSATSPDNKNQATHTVSVKLLLAGKDITQDPAGLLSLSIYKELNRVPSSKIIIADGKVEKGKFEKSGSPKFAPGNTIDVQLGYQNKTDSIFKGLIVKHSIRTSSSRPSVLELECKDPTIHLTLIRRSRYFIGMKDKDVFREILNYYSGKGVSVGTLADTEFKHPELVQYHCTDWDFLVMRAEANGLVVMVENGKVSIVKPEKATKTDFDVTWGDDIIDFEAEIDARTHYPDVEVSTWDSTKPDVVTEKGSGNTGVLGGGNPLLGGLAQAAKAIGDAIEIDLGIEDDTHTFPEVFYKDKNPRQFHGGDMDTQELSAWAKAQKQRGDLSQVRGRVKVRGKDFKPLQTMKLQKVSGRFNGSHLVTGVLHQLHHGTWESDIQFGFSTKIFAQTAPDITIPDASGLVPAIQGLHIGIVTAIKGDDVNGGHRIKVKIPFVASQGGSNDGIWARLATLSAGKERGFVFRPELNDEVILGFINNDPNDAIVLGALHSSQHKAPIEPKETNPQQGYFAKKGMSLVFDDDNKSIELKTKEGYSILLDEKDGKIEIKDKNSNSIKLSSSGIDLKAAGSVNIEAGTGKNVSIKGTKILLNS